MNPYAPPTATSPNPGALVIPVAGLEGRVLIRGRTLFGRPGFIVDGALRKSVRGVVEVFEASGRVHKLRVRGIPFDPCPRVEVDGVIVDVFPRLPGWASVLCMLPLLLILNGGALGGLLGVFATYGNFLIARSRAPAAARIALGAILTAATYALMVAVGLLIHSLRR